MPTGQQGPQTASFFSFSIKLYCLPINIYQLNIMNKGKKATKNSSADKTQSNSQLAPITKTRGVSSSTGLSIESFWSLYSKITDTHTKMIDLFILYLVVIITCQIFYRIVVGDDFPRNAFVSGIFCPLGVIVLLAILRGRERSLRQLAQFFIACLVLFLTAINFAG